MRNFKNVQDFNSQINISKYGIKFVFYLQSKEENNAPPSQFYAFGIFPYPAP
jgi:hypothetical protein